MKAIQFRKLIREEVRRALKEVAGKAYALVIDEDGNFMQEDLASYFEETAGYEEPTKLTAAKVAKFPTEFDAWANAPELAKAENVKWVKAVASLNATCDFYDVLGDGGENAFIAAVPKGSNVEDFMGEVEEGFRKGLREVTAKFKVGQTVDDLNGDEAFTVKKVYPNLQAALADLKSTQSPSNFKKIADDVKELYRNYRPIGKSDNNKPWYILEPIEGSFGDYPYLNPEVYVSPSDEDQETSSTSVDLKPNKVYMVFVTSDGRVAKPMAAGYSIEDLASEYKQDGDKVKKLDKDTYVVSRGTDFTVFGKPTSPQYAEFWDLVSQGGNARQKASALAKSMVK